MELKPKLLLQEIRSNLVELQFYGYIIHCDSKKNITSLGETNNCKFFQRSCAKPLQAAIITDLKTKEFYNLTDEEIAVCCASHTGEPIHTEILKNLLQKGGLTEDDLQCPAIEPLNKEEQKKFTEYSRLHNNCSGKHTLMLLICKQMGWDTKTYLEKNHPLQLKIYEKIKSLCEEKDDLPYTLDGCTAPNWATTLEGISKGFYNIFCTENYPDIKYPFLNNPYLIGGKDRPDTQIMLLDNKLVAKAGAGGILSIANTEKKETLTFKIIDADMKARSIIAIESLLQLGWLDVQKTDKNLLEKTLNKKVLTETGEQIGEYRPTFNISRMF